MTGEEFAAACEHAASKVTAWLDSQDLLDVYAATGSADGVGEIVNYFDSVIRIFAQAEAAKVMAVRRTAK